MVRTFLFATAALAVAAGPALAQSPSAPAKPADPKKPPAVEGVTVTGAAPPVRTSIDRKSYDVSKDLQATSGSISDALRNIPSVEVDVQGNLSLRGDPNVTIMIDGKESGRFRGDGKAQALQSLPADQIERVEVITNPSAAFSPNGTAGVINLITKKTAKPGLTGSVRANVGSGGRQNAGLSVSRKEGRFTLSSDLYLRHDSFKQHFDSDRTFADPAGGQDEELRRSASTATVGVTGLRGEVDFDADEKTQITAAVDYSGQTYANHQIDAIDRTSPLGAPRLGYDNFIELRQGHQNLETTFGYHRKLGEDREFNVSLTRELNDDDRSRPLLRDFRMAALDTVEDNEGRNHFWRTQLKADYSTPLPGQAKLKLGYELSADDNDYNLVFGAGPASGPIAIDTARSNLFQFDQQVHAVFATYERPIGKLTVLAGLRAEATLIDLDQVTQGRKDSNDDVSLYPSLHLGYRLDENRQLAASYSHRIQRPEPRYYNAFRIYTDPQNQFQGNPRLKPQQTDSFELGYQYRKSGTILLATAYFRDTRDTTGSIFENVGDGAILQTIMNIGAARSAGVELVANGHLPWKLSYNVSSNLMWTQIDARGLGAGARLQSAYTASGRASLSWQATGRDFLQAQAFLNAKQLFSQGYADPQVGVSLGYRHKFDDKLSAVITAQDVFDTVRLHAVVTTPAYREVNRIVPRNRGVFVGFSYAFGGAKPRDTFDFGQGGGGPPSN